MLHKRQCENITFSVSTVGNIDALQLCLASVLNAQMVPKAINLRFEGELPGFARFYLEQLSELARISGIDWTMTIGKPKGIRYARDWMIDSCPTDWIWMGDDDVVYRYDCLAEYHSILSTCVVPLKTFGWLAGVKVDVNNRRGYPDHSMTRMIYDRAQNHFYDTSAFERSFTKIDSLDTGNVLFYVPNLRRLGCRFQILTDVNSGAEDAVFAMAAKQKGLQGYLARFAESVHLEKEKVFFDEKRNREAVESLARTLLEAQKHHI